MRDEIARQKRRVAWRGRDKRVYASAFVIVTYLELLGTAVGAWRWQPHNPVLHWISTGNPPSGAAGGYCFFDAAALPAETTAGTRLRISEVLENSPPAATWR